MSLQHLPRHQQTCAALLAAPAPPAPPPQRPQLPKLVYALLKEPELRRKLKELGLNTKGDKQVLVKRHKRFCLLYNVERDAGRHRADSWLAARVAREEQEELAGRTATPALLNYDKKTDAKVMEEKKKSYMKQNSSTFAKLVSQARQGKARVEGALVKETVTGTDDEVFAGTQEPREAGASSKRRLVSSPAGLEESKRQRPEDPPRTPVKEGGGVGKLYVTPTKAQVTQLAKSPKLRNINIIDQLNRSAEQSRRVERAACPVCGLEVQQRFLNIHLDKCLRAAEPEASPVVGRTRRKARAASTASSIASNMFAVEPAEAGDAPLPTDFLELVEEREERRSFGTNELFEVMEVKGARKEKDGEQVENVWSGDDGFQPGDGARPGETLVKSVGEEVRPGDEGLRPGDEGLRPGDESVRPGDEVGKPGDEGVRAGEGCSSPSYSPPESPSLLEVEPSQHPWGRGEKEKEKVERVEEEVEDMFADSEEIDKDASVKQVEEVKVMKRVKVVKSVRKTSDKSVKTRDLSEIQTNPVKKRFHKRVNASHRASLEHDPRAMDMTSSQEVVVREVTRSQGRVGRSQEKMGRSQEKVGRSQGKVGGSQEKVVKDGREEGAARSTRSRRNASVLLGGAST